MEQLDLFHLLDDQAPEFVCDTCLFDINGCCSFSEPCGRYCTLGDSKVDINTPVEYLPKINAKIIANYIGQKLGLQFREEMHGTGRHRAMSKRKTFTIYLDRYEEGVFDGQKFISVDADDRFEHSGSGTSCLTIQDAVDVIRYWMQVDTNGGEE